MRFHLTKKAVVTTTTNYIMSTTNYTSPFFTRRRTSSRSSSGLFFSFRQALLVLTTVLVLVVPMTPSTISSWIAFSAAAVPPNCVSQTIATPVTITINPATDTNFDLDLGDCVYNGGITFTSSSAGTAVVGGRVRMHGGSAASITAAAALVLGAGSFLTIDGVAVAGAVLLEMDAVSGGAVTVTGSGSALAGPLTVSAAAAFQTGGKLVLEKFASTSTVSVLGAVTCGSSALLSDFSAEAVEVGGSVSDSGLTIERLRLTRTASLGAGVPNALLAFKTLALANARVAVVGNTMALGAAFAADTDNIAAYWKSTSAVNTPIAWTDNTMAAASGLVFDGSVVGVSTNSTLWMRRNNITSVASKVALSVRLSDSGRLVFDETNAVEGGTVSVSPLGATSHGNLLHIRTPAGTAPRTISALQWVRATTTGGTGDSVLVENTRLTGASTVDMKSGLRNTIAFEQVFLGGELTIGSPSTTLTGATVSLRGSVGGADSEAMFTTETSSVTLNFGLGINSTIQVVDFTAHRVEVKDSLSNVMIASTVVVRDCQLRLLVIGGVWRNASTLFVLNNTILYKRWNLYYLAYFPLKLELGSVLTIARNYLNGTKTDGNSNSASCTAIGFTNTPTDADVFIQQNTIFTHDKVVAMTSVGAGATVNFTANTITATLVSSSFFALQMGDGRHHYDRSNRVFNGGSFTLSSAATSTVNPGDYFFFEGSQFSSLSLAFGSSWATARQNDYVRIQNTTFSAVSVNFWQSRNGTLEFDNVSKTTGISSNTISVSTGAAAAVAQDVSIFIKDADMTLLTIGAGVFLRSAITLVDVRMKSLAQQYQSVLNRTRLSITKLTASNNLSPVRFEGAFVNASTVSFDQCALTATASAPLEFTQLFQSGASFSLTHSTITAPAPSLAAVSFSATPRGINTDGSVTFYGNTISGTVVAALGPEAADVVAASTRCTGFTFTGDSVAVPANNKRRFVCAMTVAGSPMTPAVLDFAASACGTSADLCGGAAPTVALSAPTTVAPCWAGGAARAHTSVIETNPGALAAAAEDPAGIRASASSPESLSQVLQCAAWEVLAPPMCGSVLMGVSLSDCLPTTTPAPTTAAPSTTAATTTSTAAAATTTAVSAATTTIPTTQMVGNTTAAPPTPTPVMAHCAIRDPNPKPYVERADPVIYTEWIEPGFNFVLDGNNQQVLYPSNRIEIFITEQTFVVPYGQFRTLMLDPSRGFCQGTGPASSKVLCRVINLGNYFPQRESFRITIGNSGCAVRPSWKVNILKSAPSSAAVASDSIMTVGSAASSAAMLIFDGTAVEVQAMIVALRSLCATTKDRDSTSIVRFFLSPFAGSSSSAVVVLGGVGIVAGWTLVHLLVTVAVARCYVMKKTRGATTTTSRAPFFEACCITRFPSIPAAIASFLYMGIAAGTLELLQTTRRSCWGAAKMTTHRLRHLLLSACPRSSLDFSTCSPFLCSSW